MNDTIQQSDSFSCMAQDKTGKDIQIWTYLQVVHR